MICGTDGCEREVAWVPNLVAMTGYLLKHTDDGSVECRVGTCDVIRGETPHIVTDYCRPSWTPCTATVAS